jgi:hypothetical protein
MVFRVVASRRADSMHHVAARVQALGQAADRPALPCRVPALKGDDDRALLLVHLKAELREPHLEPDQVDVILFWG